MKMWDLFAGLDRAYGTYRVQERDGEKLAGAARTVQQPLNQDIWDLHMSGERSLGVVPIRDDSTTVFAAIDIDTYPLDHAELEKHIEELSLPLVVCRSKSGGAHLYVFIKSPGTLALNIRPKLAEWAAELGYADVEIFPKQDELRNKDDVGNWINMPYFGGDEDKLRYAFKNGKRLSVAQFIKHAQSKQITHQQVEDFEIKGPEIADIEGGPPCLQTLARGGFPSGSRNISLFNLGVFARKKWPDDWQDKIDDLNEKFLEPPLGPGEVAQVKRNLDRKSYFYKCSDAPINAVCQRGKCRMRPFGIGDEYLPDTTGFKIEGPIRILTEDIYYIATVNGKRVSLDANSMCTLHAFKVSVMRQTGHMVPNLKAAQFGQLIQNMTLTAQEVEAPQHTGKRGMLIQEVLHVCSGANVADNWTQCASGLPMPDKNGGVYMHPVQMTKMLKKRLSSRSLMPQDIYESLRAEGVEIEEQKHVGRIFWKLGNLKLLEQIVEEEML